MERVWAWAVHAYTTSGVVLALLMVHFAYQGEVETVLWLFLAAMVVDGTDGMLARRLRVKEVVPGFDGALLDNIVDYITYAFAPMVLLWATGYLPADPWGGLVAALPLVASCFQFCRVDAKTDDHFFLGFPSYWNIVALYAILGHTDPTMLGALLLICSALVFVPIRYIYPTRTVALMPITLGLGTLWGIAVLILLLQLPHPDPWLVNLSYLYIVYYVAASLYLNRIPS